VGDQVLVATVERIAEQMREHEIFGRLGGEEFAIVVPRADEEAATILAERLRESLQATPIPTLAGPVELSASFGISSLSPARSSVEALLRAADEALYRAKAAGRNRIEVAARVPPASAPRAAERAPRSREKVG
jgi:diguanylate cyclase (GGDEF)-like protein